MVALVVVGVLAALGIVGAVVAVNIVGDAVEDSFQDGGIPGLAGGECGQFMFSYMSLSMMGMMTAGADETQRQEIESALGDIRELAPSDIEDEIAVVGDAFGEAMALGMSGGPGGQPSAADQAEAEAILESPEVVAAQDEINAWVDANCS